MVTVLGFDCAGIGCSAAVLCDGTVAARRAEAMERGQAERLLPMIAAVLDEAGVQAGTLDLIAVTVGPGGFTGLRIGLAAARGLALATGVPVLGVTNFAAVAAGVPPAARVGRSLVVALDSKRAEFYLQVFGSDGSPQGDGALVASSALGAWLPEGPLLLAGDAASRLGEALPGRDVVLAAAPALPDPVVVARLAASLWQPGDRPPSPRPLYLRAPDTTPPRRPARTT